MALKIDRLTIRAFWKANRKGIGFVLRFVFFYLLLQGINFLAYPTIRPILVDIAHVEASAWIVDRIDPDCNVVAKENRLRFTGGEIVIATGCDGIDGMIIIVAAVLAFPLGLADRVKGLAAGVTVMYLANLLRIIGLLYIYRFKPSIFADAHFYAGQAFIIFVGFLFYIAWLTRCGSSLES